MSSRADKGRRVPAGESGAAAVGGKPESRPRYITSPAQSAADGRRALPLPLKTRGEYIYIDIYLYLSIVP